jgi:hypothetical protein
VKTLIHVFQKRGDGAAVTCLPRGSPIYLLGQAVRKLPAPAVRLRPNCSAVLGIAFLRETSSVRFLKTSLASSAGIVGCAEGRAQTMKH